MESSIREKFGSAIKSREENAWLGDLQFQLDKFRSVQNTYKVQLMSYPDIGYLYQIWLLWDYDRIWGVFDMGYTKGVFLVDPGPKLVFDDDEEPQPLPFAWRGIRKSEPDTFICNELIAKGELCIDTVKGVLKGHFEFMEANGDTGDSRCDFRAKQHFGPAVVPYSLEGIVEEWNEYGVLCEEETVRQNLSLEDLEADLRERDERQGISKKTRAIVREWPQTEDSEVLTSSTSE